MLTLSRIVHAENCRIFDPAASVALFRRSERRQGRGVFRNGCRCEQRDGRQTAAGNGTQTGNGADGTGTIEGPSKAPAHAAADRPLPVARSTVLFRTSRRFHLQQLRGTELQRSASSSISLN